MPISLSNTLNIPSSKFEELGCFNPILDLDTRLFIDPRLLKDTMVPELTESYAKLQRHFKNIHRLLSNSDAKNPKCIFWNKALKLMQWREVKGLCIGYSTKGTAGSGTGEKLKTSLLTTAKTLIDKGRDDPELFELVGLFVDDFGPDRISDMTANLIKEDLIAYSKRVFGSLNIDLKKVFRINLSTGLPINPNNQQDIILLPSSILRDLPLALDWSSIDQISIHNEELRSEVNKIIGETWKQATATKKDYLKDLVLEHPELFDDLLHKYKAKDRSQYDFDEDRSGQYIWYKFTEDLASKFPLKLKISNHPNIDEVENLVLAICNKFTDLIENNGWSKLLYNKDGSAKHEEASQLLFYGVSEIYCSANGVLLCRESNSGRGPVDFKFGTNMQNSVLVEIKKSSNTSLKKCIEKQIPTYMKSEKSKRSIYLVINVEGTQRSLDKINELKLLSKDTSIKIIQADGVVKESASK